MESEERVRKDPSADGTFLRILRKSEEGVGILSLKMHLKFKPFVSFNRPFFVFPKSLRERVGKA